MFPFSLLVARRYLFARKSHNAVNIISAVSAVGVCIGAFALIIVMSVFNGFEELTERLYSTFDPDLKVTVANGKSFTADTAKLQQLMQSDDIFAFSLTVEENVMVQYGDQQEIAIMKGVDSQYSRVTGIDTMMYEGNFTLRIDDIPQAVAGLSMAYKLKIGLHFLSPLHFWIVRNKQSVSLNPEQDLNDKLILPSGKFAIDEDIDSKYIIVPLEFARSLLDNDTIISAIEIKLRSGVNETKAQRRIAAIFGEEFSVKTRRQQKEFAYKILKSEKFMAFMILSFVLLIASFNVVGSLSILMIEKKNDMFILQSMGCDRQRLSNIFMFQGWMIVIAGAFAGLLLGALLCMMQIKFGFFRVNSSGTYIIESYPVALRLKDFAMILIAVAGVSFLTIYFPVKYFVRKYIIS